MDNQIDPAVGNWYQHLDDGRLFQVVAVDDEEELVEFQHFDGAIEEVSLDEWRTWDLTVTDAPGDWTGPIDEVRRDDLGDSEGRSAGERRGFGLERWQEDEEAGETAGTTAAAGEPPATAQSEPAGREHGLSRKRINDVKKRLSDRREQLREDILRELRKYDDESYIELAGRVADSGDSAFADLVSDLNLAEVTRDVNEARGIEAAFGRLAEGKYGICLSCGERIDRQRLEAVPAALRCFDCQRALERREGEDRYPSL